MPGKARSQFEWINLDQNPSRSNKATQRKIRAHVAARKKPDGWERRNTRQPPVFFNTHESPNNNSGRLQNAAPISPNTNNAAIGGAAFSGEDEPEDLSQMVDVEVEPQLSQAMSMTGLDLLRAETGIDILRLSVLTEVHSNQVASSALTEQPDQLIILFRLPKKSYLSFMPSRYGHSSCLDDAIRCVATRAKSVLTRQAPDRKELFLYGTALRSLQIAVNDPGGAWKNPDVLCATQILSIFEVLRPSHAQAWSQHIIGASRLIYARGPSGFTSDFEKSLFLTWTGPFVYECIMGNEACFLEEELWQDLLRSFIKPHDLFSPTSHIAISLTCILARLPGLLKKVSVAVDDPSSMSHEDLSEQRRSIRIFREDLLRWRAKYDSVLLRSNSRADHFAPGEDLRFELLGFSYGIWAVGCRILSSIWMESMELLEDDAVTYAALMLDFARDIPPERHCTKFFLRQKAEVCKGILATTELWRDRSDTSGSIVSKNAFRAWCSSIPGRRVFL
ncbi:hypothetical protein F5Y19DRAFT_456424 [Xylariaceae sp. FL1651]|nr:hypothetical protein F5Y19DRAFT_456424 [Xylariaceae sp. FL1651]